MDGKLQMELYPKNKNEQWDYKGLNKLIPAKRDVENIIKLINKITGDTTSNIEIVLKDMLVGNPNNNYSEYKVDLIKGSIYKIKKYFLENNKIKDIRGGSKIIDYLNIELIENLFKELNLGTENIVYTGGGNILIIVPQGKGEEICKEIELEYAKVALTVMNAFVTEEITLNEFLFDYKKVSRNINDKLEERKKVKLYPGNPDSNLKYIEINGEKIKINKYEKIESNNAVCKLCNVRTAKYYIHGENIKVCPSCARKNTVGSEKSSFYDEFEKVTNTTMKYKDTIQTIGDIDKEEIAVIYGDGNNMGQIVMNISNPLEMMYFSRKTDEVTKKSVYLAINEIMGNGAKFEVVALGGDDIFIIVPKKQAIKITKKIIENFDKEFSNTITMSAGIAIASSNTPIAQVFKVAQGKLKDAKKYLKQNVTLKEGSIDIAIIEGSANEYSREGKLLPLSLTQFKEIEKILKEYEKRVGKTKLHKINYACQNMMEQEFELFFMYLNNRSGNILREFIDKIDNVSGKMDKENKWDDIILLWELMEGK